MLTKALLLTFAFFLALSTVASADSVNGIAMNGAAEYGFAAFNGDFRISGPGLFLEQGTPDGPNEIGNCAVGAMCNFSFSIGSTATFCTYCTGFSDGSVGNKTAEFLDPSLTFTGSAFYSGGTSISVPMTVTGTIVGYELINCTDGVDCSLGPKEFTIHIDAHGTGAFTMTPLNPFENPIDGVNVNFTGTATTTPEPISLVLTGTGLLGILIRKRVMRTQV